MMSIESFIGTKISLISKIGIRYEGTLHSLNTDEGTIVLNDVRSMGTEGRGKHAEVQPSSKVHDFIVFRGEDINDLIVDEVNNKSYDDPIFDDPAICKAYNSKDLTTSSGSKPLFNTSSLHSKSDNMTSNIASQSVQFSPFVKNSNSKLYGLASNSVDRDLETFQFDEFLTHRSSTNLFNDNSAENARTAVDEPSKSCSSELDSNKKYDKKSFYDNLSNDKQLSKEALREERQKQRKIDIETFGRQSFNRWNSRRSGQRRNNQYNRHGDKNDTVQAGWEKDK